MLCHYYVFVVATMYIWRRPERAIRYCNCLDLKKFVEGEDKVADVAVDRMIYVTVYSVFRVGSKCVVNVGYLKPVQYQAHISAGMYISVQVCIYQCRYVYISAGMYIATS